MFSNNESSLTYEPTMWEEQKQFMKQKVIRSIIGVLGFAISAVFTLLSYFYEWYSISTFLTVLTFIGLIIVIFLMYNVIIAIFETPWNYLKFKKVKDYLEKKEAEKLAKIIEENGPGENVEKNFTDVSSMRKILRGGFIPSANTYMEGPQPQPGQTESKDDFESEFKDPRQYLPLRNFSYWYCALCALSELVTDKALAYVYFYTTMKNNFVLSLYAKRAIRRQAKKLGYSNVYKFIEEKELGRKVQKYLPVEKIESNNNSTKN
ncbi:MAG: hypothetical protein U9O98_02935 [Asgard group archaeon]|nr:hypothetical protein [Asgard group archaeon]